MSIFGRWIICFTVERLVALVVIVKTGVGYCERNGFWLT
jgi:hypothetical protein